jgi:hypothetical protein
MPHADWKPWEAPIPPGMSTAKTTIRLSLVEALRPGGYRWHYSHGCGTLGWASGRVKGLPAPEEEAS